MATEIYIGTERADFNGDITVLFSSGDIRDITSGGSNTSYEITLPLTSKNKRLLKFSDHTNVFDEVSSIGTIEMNGLIVLQGKVTVLTFEKNISATIIIQGSLWYDRFKDVAMSSLDLSAHDHEYNSTNITASWTGSANFYRYPMINFGRLFTQTIGDAAVWSVNDFIPMFRIVDLMTAIVYPFTLTGSWLTAAAEKYILGVEQRASNDFLGGKKIDVQVYDVNDNYYEDTITAGATKTITFTETKIDFDDVNTDEGSNWAYAPDSWYLIPTSGTYQFVLNCYPKYECDGSHTINSQQLVLRIKRDRGGTVTTLETLTVNYVSSNIFNGTTLRSLSTSFIHLLSGDKIYATLYMTQNIHSTDIDTISVVNYLELTSKFYNTVDDRCLMIGIGATIDVSKWMPDCTQMDFMNAIKQAYGLKFTVDTYRQIVYVEAADTCLGEHPVVLDKCDIESVNTENIATHYKSKLILKLLTDKSDKAVTDYLLANTEPYKKEIILTSKYTDKGEEFYENTLFAWTASGVFNSIAPTSITIVRIFGNAAFIADGYYPAFRAAGFAPRLFTWNGLTSGLSWYLNSSAYTTYPKVSTEDMSVIYPTNLLKTFHLIDIGKILKINIVPNAMMMQQFITVVNDIDHEGFRASYEFDIDGERFAGYLNRIEFNGDKALMELIIKH